MWEFISRVLQHQCSAFSLPTYPRYIKLFMLIFIILLLLTFFILFLLNFLSSFISNNSFSEFSREEARRYECGFEQNSVSRVPLSIRYFILTLVFLVFDIEIILLLFTPFELFLSLNTSYVIFLSLIFILLLFLGLLYEWFDGALEWII